MVKTAEQKPEILEQSKIFWGIAASNLGNPYNTGYQIPERLDRMSNMLSVAGMGLELQPEEGINIFPFSGRENLSFLGIHLPAQGINLNDRSMLDDSRQKIKQVILDGIELKADYLCYHMQTTDYWDRIDKREDLIKESYDEAYHLMVFAGQKGFSGKFLIENLEYPKYPSTLGEMLAVREFLSIFPNSGILFDVAHQWHSCYLIREHQKDFVIQYPADIYLKSDGAYPAYLGATLKSLRPDAIHITGGSESGNKTHQMPEIEQVRENGSETVLDTGNAIRQIASAAASASKKMYMVNEAIGYPYEEMVKANVSLSELTRHL